MDETGNLEESTGKGARETIFSIKQIVKRILKKTPLSQLELRDRGKGGGLAK